MNTCGTCRHWNAMRTYGPVNKGTGMRPLLTVHNVGSCTRFKSTMIESEQKFDEVEIPPRRTSGHGESDGGYLTTGRFFGCIHYTR